MAGRTSRSPSSVSHHFPLKQPHSCQLLHLIKRGQWCCPAPLCPTAATPLRWEWLVAAPTTVPDSGHTPPLGLACRGTHHCARQRPPPFAGSGLSRHPPLWPLPLLEWLVAARAVGRGHDLTSKQMFPHTHTHRLEVENDRRSLVWSLCFHTRIQPCSK